MIAAKNRSFWPYGYVYDNDTNLYYLQSRYYDPELGRFINADAFTSTGQGLLGNNMFAYCGNNPVIRKDTEGDLWQQVALGVITQYAADVLGNYFDGKTGAELFIPTSSLAEYAAAAVTAIIPGKGIGGALMRSVISESMTWTENILEGNGAKNNLESSFWNVVLNTGADVVLGGVMDSFDKAVETPDFSAYAKRLVHKGTGLTLQQMNSRMRYANKMNQILNGLVSMTANIEANYILP